MKYCIKLFKCIPRTESQSTSKCKVRIKWSVLSVECFHSPVTFETAAFSLWDLSTRDGDRTQPSITIITSNRLGSTHQCTNLWPCVCVCIWIWFSAFLSYSIPLCSLINQYLSNLARKFPETKFLKSISSVCIPNYPDKNLPTIFVYFENDLKKQFVGPFAVGGLNSKQDGECSLDPKGLSVEADGITLPFPSP